MSNQKIKYDWQKPLTNNERIEILFMKIQELKDKIEQIQQIKKEKMVNRDYQLNNSQKKCKWLYADWCHHPDDEEQEKCGFYFENYKCPGFNEEK